MRFSNLDSFIEELKSTYKDIFNSKKKVDVMIERAYGKNLGEVSEKNNISRERVRQIDKKSVELINKTFNYYEEDMLKYFFDDNYVFNEKLFTKNIGHLLNITKYSLSFNSGNIKYNPIIDSIYYDNENLEYLLKMLLFGKDAVEVENIPVIKEKLMDSSDTTRYLINQLDIEELLLENGFTLYDDIYLKKPLTLKLGILMTLEKYFPDGVDTSHVKIDGKKVYSEETIRLSNILKEKYNLNSKTIPSLIARIQSTCLICGKSKYIHPSKIKIDSFTAHSILSIVKQKGSTGIYMDSLYEYCTKNNEEIYLDPSIDSSYKLNGAIVKYFRQDKKTAKQFKLIKRKIVYIGE